MSKKVVISSLVALAFTGSALATVQMQKEYKEKDPKANCQTCHVDKMPKKGAADLNDFGKKVLGAKGADGKIDWTKVS
jgi:hypothetical protein